MNLASTAPQQQQQQKIETIFRRPLPKPAIDLSSDEGQSLFASALAKQGMRCFFPLIQHQSHQASPAYCGLATLATVLNALGCDPHRTWKGVWRYYTEELLDCCIPLDEVNKTGIDFDSLKCLARCNGLAVVARRADDISVEEFRQKVHDLTKRNDIFLAVSYSRRILNQTGDGHWSPIGGYDSSSDMVLILDQARFKYNAHWVPLVELYKAMDTVDQDTRKKRGYFELTAADKQNGPPPAAAFSLSIGFYGTFLRVKDELKQLPLDTRAKWSTELGQDAEKILNFVANSLEQFMSNRMIVCREAEKDVSDCDVASNRTLTSCCVGETTTSITKTGELVFTQNGEDDEELLLEVMQTRTYRILASGSGDQHNDIKRLRPDPSLIKRALLVLSLDEEFWTQAIGERADELFETVKSESRLGRALIELRKRLRMFI